MKPGNQLNGQPRLILIAGLQKSGGDGGEIGVSAHAAILAAPEPMKTASRPVILTSAPARVFTP